MRYEIIKDKKKKKGPILVCPVIRESVVWIRDNDCFGDKPPSIIHRNTSYEFNDDKRVEGIARHCRLEKFNIRRAFLSAAANYPFKLLYFPSPIWKEKKTKKKGKKTTHTHTPSFWSSFLSLLFLCVIFNREQPPFYLRLPKALFFPAAEELLVSTDLCR